MYLSNLKSKLAVSVFFQVVVDVSLLCSAPILTSEIIDQPELGIVTPGGLSTNQRAGLLTR